MIKGHVKINIKDKDTGEIIKTIEADNIVTEAVEKATKSVVHGSSSSYSTPRGGYRSFQPLYQYGLGGLLAFDDVLDEDTVAIPSYPHLTGWTNNATHQVSADKNEVTSTFTIYGVRGTISSVARTHYVGGICPFQVSYDSSYPRLYVDSVYMGDCGVIPIKYDKEKGIVYSASYSWTEPDGQGVISKHGIAIFKEQLPLQDIQGVRGEPNNWGTYPKPTMINHWYSSEYPYHRFHLGMDGHAYTVWVHYNSDTNDYNIRIGDINLDDFSISIIDLPKLSHYDSYNWYKGIVYKRILYYKNPADSSDMRIFKYNLDSGETELFINQETQEVCTTYFDYTAVHPSGAGILFLNAVQADTYTYDFFYEDGTKISYGNSSNSNWYPFTVLDADEILCSEYRTIWITPMYIGTICNFPSVTLSGETAEVIYTLKNEG